jgi:hypothetical protein
MDKNKITITIPQGLAKLIHNVTGPDSHYEATALYLMYEGAKQYIEAVEGPEFFVELNAQGKREATNDMDA